MDLFSQLHIDGIPLVTVLLIFLGVFLAGLIDAVAGGGGIISIPTYLAGLHDMPTYFALGTNKLSSCIGTIFSTTRFIRNGYVNWKLAIPSAVLAVIGSIGGTYLQHHTPDVVLKYILLAILPVVAFFTLHTKDWPDHPDSIPSSKQALIVCTASLLIGGYDGYYGPGTGTFLMLIFIRFAKMDTRTAAGNVKIVNLSSNIGSLYTAWRGGYVLWGIGLIAAGASILGHYLGAGLAIKNGNKIVRPMLIVVLILLTLKIFSELFIMPLCA